MNELIITAPEGAAFCLYPGIPAAWKFSELDADAVIPATKVTLQEGSACYHYAELAPGLYHYSAVMEGYYSLCRMVNHTGLTQLNVTLEKKAGTGYEGDSLMLCTEEFEKSALVSHKGAWGPDYEKLFCTPWFSTERPSRHQQTTNEEMMAFIEKLQKTNKYMHIFSLGKSPKYGFDMPLVLFTQERVEGLTLEQAAKLLRNNGKPTVQYTAQCHSSEPASCEGALAMMISLCGDYGKVLNSLDLYIIPRINPDGAFEAVRFAPTTGEDMNRDYLYMHNQEPRMIVSAFNMFHPEVAIDGHEKRMPRDNIEDICTDVELQANAGGMNHPTAMTKLAMKMAFNALENAKSLNLRGHFYARLASAAGGVAGSSYHGCRNALSFLIETPGQTNVGGCFLERRVMSQYAVISAIIEYVAANTGEILATIHDSRAFMRKTGPIYDEADVIVLEHEPAETGTWPVPLLHVSTGQVIDPNHQEPYTEHAKALLTRPRATAYVIPAGLPQEEGFLRLAVCHDLDQYRLPAGSEIPLQQYVQEGDSIVLAPEQVVTFEDGAYVFPNTIDSTILGMIMEPDFNPSKPQLQRTVLRMGLICADGESRLPLYRYCHDLKNGKI